MIKEVIVVEGKDDVAAVKNAVDADVIAVGGFGINKNIIESIKEAQNRQGVIVLTDPDFAGEKIRSIIAKRVKGIKHAYIMKDEGLKDGDIGVENASKESIIKALENSKCQRKDVRNEFTTEDLLYFGLVGREDSKYRREEVARTLRIGYCNANQFIKRLNNYGITKEEFTEAIKMIGR